SISKTHHQRTRCGTITWSNGRIKRCPSGRFWQARREKVLQILRAGLAPYLIEEQLRLGIMPGEKPQPLLEAARSVTIGSTLTHLAIEIDQPGLQLIPAHAGGYRCLVGGANALPQI